MVVSYKHTSRRLFPPYGISPPQARVWRLCSRHTKRGDRQGHGAPASALPKSWLPMTANHGTARSSLEYTCAHTVLKRSPVAPVQ